METMQGRSAEENGAPALFLAAGERGTIMRTYTCTQEEQIRGMMERPIPRKKIGIVHLEMVKERRTLYGMGRFRDPREAAGMAAASASSCSQASSSWPVRALISLAQERSYRAETPTASL